MVFDIWARGGVLGRMLQDRQGASRRQACLVSARVPSLPPEALSGGTWNHHLLASTQALTCPNTSFTDLAAIVSRIEPAKAAAVDGELDARARACPAEGDGVS